ncbi:DUF3305 domain-containing protein [Photobacterium sanguinicancri]|uniref:DUF3305 domain-containing protein n=1 Tax=Photobacterium sanguinicancri TaxID=875932 RepID=A0ABX4G034_9GAMM|nr:DUF3305 domain-containing protein [Photobacterium sanguinicancri]
MLLIFIHDYCVSYVFKNKGVSVPDLYKNESIWPIGFRLVSEEKQVGRWSTLSWSIEDVELHEEQRAAESHVLPLELFRDERSDYRFNLSSRDPHLFIVCEEENEQLKPVHITAAQSVASSYMDGDYQVLHITTPLPVQAWMEAFIGRHGELIEGGRKKCKNRKGKGRSSGK